MAWKTITREDLGARIDLDELDAYASLQSFGDPVQYLIDQTADEVRGYISANRFAILCDTPHTVPPMLVGPSCDLAVYAVLKRIGTPVSESRQKAYDSARDLLEKIAEGKITPDPGKTVTPETSNVAAPSISVKPPIL